MSASSGLNNLTSAARSLGRTDELPIGAVARTALRPSVVRAVASAGDSGRPLGSAERSLFRPLIGEGFDDARIHTGPAAESTARVLGADAFTIGRDVFFARGRFDPGTARGRALLAHELTHVRQQTLPGIGGIFGHGEAEPPLEAEATAVEVAVAEGALESGSLQVGRLTRFYVSSDGGSLPAGARERLDAISRRALDVARGLLDSDLALAAPIAIPRVRVDVRLDLGRLTDDDAARVWGESIADAVRRELRAQPASPGQNVEYRDFEDVQLSPATTAAPARAQPAAGAVTQVNYYELMSYLSQPEHHKFVMTSAEENLGGADALQAMGVQLRDAVLANWQAGGAPLTTTQIYNMAYGLTSHSGTALLLCHNLLRTFARGGTDIPWSRHADPEMRKQGYYADGVRAFKPEVINPGGRLVIIGKAEPRPSIFYVLFAADELGTEDPGDWYHHFAIATTAHYVASGEMNYDPPSTMSRLHPSTALGEYTTEVVADVVGKLRDRSDITYFDPKQREAYDAWTVANAVSFLEGAHYGGPQDEVERETLVHRRAAAFGLREAGFRGLPLGFDWVVPKAGSVTVWGTFGDIGTYVQRVIGPQEAIPETLGGPAAPATTTTSVQGASVGLQVPPAPVTTADFADPSVDVAKSRRIVGPRPPAISARMVELMRADVDRIVDVLKQQIIPESDERAILAIIGKWAGADDQHRAISGYEGSDYLDRFLLLLKTRTFTRSTARTLWIEQTQLAFDELWRELEDDRLGEFRALLARSKRENTTGPALERGEGVLEAVVEPVFFKATSLLSFGIVDKELFTGSYDAAMRGGFTAQMEFIGKRVGRAAVDLLTLGAGMATYEAAERYLEAHPGATWTEVSEECAKAAGNAILPLPEMLTIAKAAGIAAPDANELPPDKWQAAEAFFQGMLKVISLGAMAHGRVKAARRPGLREPTASDLHGRASGESRLAGHDGAVGESTTGGRARVPNGLPIDSNFAGTLESGGWAQHVKSLVEQGRLAEAEALERGRSGIADMLESRFGAKRTGTRRAVSDMDVTMPSYEAVARAKARLVRDLLGLEYEKMTHPEQLASWDRVHQMLDLTLMTDPTRLTIYEAPGLSWLARRRVRAAAGRAAEAQRLRILKGLADKGNPEAAAELGQIAAERGIDPNSIQPLERIAEADFTPAQRARVESLKAEIDAAAKEFRLLPSERLGREIVEKQVELNGLDPEAYFDPGAVKAEVTMRDFRGRTGNLAPEEALGNISNNRVNLATELQKAGASAGSGPAAFARVGGSASFAKYGWRILRTARAMGIDVPADLLAQAERLYRGKQPAIAGELPSPAAREAFARRVFAETRLAQAEAARRVGSRADYRGIAAALAVLDAEASEALDDESDE